MRPCVRRIVDDAKTSNEYKQHQNKNMSTQKQNEYILLFRGGDWYKGLSPEEMQKVMDQWMAWFNRLTAEGKAKAGQPLEREGKIVSGKKGRMVADGPFAEAKEEVGGYFLLQVADMDEAVVIAKQCPGLDYGSIVEVRPVADVCPIKDELQQTNGQLAHAGA